MKITKITSYLLTNFLTHTSAINYDFSNYQDKTSASIESNEAFKTWKLNRKLAKDELTATIDVYYHVIIANATNEDDVDNETLLKQTAILNEAYSGVASSFYPKDCDGMPVKSGIDTTFRFRHAGVTRTMDAEGDSQATDEAIESFTDEEIMTLLSHTYPELIRNHTFRDMDALQQVQDFLNMTRQDQFQILIQLNKLQSLGAIFGRAVRVGDCSALNVVILPAVALGTVFGYAQMPHWCPEGEPFLSSDVIFISRGTLPDATGSSFPVGSTNNLDNVSYDLYRGDTLVHETGHWLNLQHPSSVIDAPSTGKDGCDFLTGDYVADTPAQAYSSSKNCPNLTEPCCPKGLDSCPHLPGEDPVENYMDYSSDCCTYTFSDGQVLRMQHSWESYRGGINGTSDRHTTATAKSVAAKNMFSMGSLCLLLHFIFFV